MQGVPQRFCCDRVWTSKAAFRGPQAYRVKLRGYGKVVNHSNALAIAANALAELQVRVVTALERSGGGLALRGEDVSDDSIRNCVTRLMSAPDFRQHAARIAREISAMPSAEEVAMRLERLGSVDD